MPRTIFNTITYAVMVVILHLPFFKDLLFHSTLRIKIFINMIDSKLYLKLHHRQYIKKYFAIVKLLYLIGITLY